MTPRRLAAPWLAEKSLARVLDALDRNGEEARVVGGAVRNALLGEPVGEIDIATTALPDEVVRRAQAAGLKAVPTGIEHGTVTLVSEGRPFEVTTLREDVETFGRHARVAFGRDWKTDAARRDFTFNALFLSRDGIVHDHAGGLSDLEHRRVRFIGNADKRIAEDYLRILRFFRFHAAFGEGALDPAGLKAAIAARAGLEGLSRERVRMELLKLLVARHAVPSLAVMAETGILVTILGGVPQLAALSNMIKIETALPAAPDAIRRLGAIAVLVEEDAQRLSGRLRLANAEHDQLAAMGGPWRAIRPGDEKPARALLYRLGPARFADRAMLAWSHASEGVKDESWRALASLPQRWSAPAFPLSAADFMSRGIAKGPKLGEALRAAEEAWIAADFSSRPDAIMRIADEAAAAAR